MWVETCGGFVEKQYIWLVDNGPPRPWRGAAFHRTSRRRVVLWSSKPIIRKAFTACWRAVARSSPRSQPTSATKSTARCAGSNTLRCGTQPTRCRHESERRTSSPPTKMVPVGGRSSPAMSCMSVLFPAPFAPRRTVSPGARSKDISRTTLVRAE